MKWETFVSNMESCPYLLSRENILNIKKKNIINKVGFGRKRKIFNPMNTTIKIKDFLKNLIKTIKNITIKNLIKRKQNSVGHGE